MTKFKDNKNIKVGEKSILIEESQFEQLKTIENQDESISELSTKNMIANLEC